MTFIDIVFAYFPVIFLVYLMVRKNAFPASRALPLSAMVVYLVVMLVFDVDKELVHASVLQGLLLALTPIMIVGGAVFLFRTLDATGALQVIRATLNDISTSPVVQLMLIGWAFPFLIEGASGFGTPAALAAPILVGLGFPPVRVAVLVLVMNSVPVSFGAVGTPTWFGFSPLGLSEQDNLLIGFRTALVHCGIAFVIPVIALGQLLEWETIKKNGVFVALCIATTVFPYTLVALYNYEFPSLIGGMTGIIATVFLARYEIGLSGEPEKLTFTPRHTDPAKNITNKDTPRQNPLILACFPFIAILVILLITRISDLGLKTLLNSTSSQVSVGLGYLGEFSVSGAAVLSLDNIFETGTNWTLSLLYIPAILPFAVVALATFYLPGSATRDVGSVVKGTLQQMSKPAIAMAGALVFVNLMMMGNEKSMVTTIGLSISHWAGQSWLFFAPLLGAMGSFFSGSATISNLTFGGIQSQIAAAAELSEVNVLALQSVGAALGNMVCINNIVAVASVLGLQNCEGSILRKTFAPMVLYAALAGSAGILFMS